MSHMFRSETMGYYSIVMPRESAWEILDEIGSNGSLHFVDQDPNNPHTARSFAGQTKRCDEVLVRLNIIQEQMVVFNRIITQADKMERVMKQDFQLLQSRFPNQQGQTIFDAIEGEVDENFKKIQDQFVNYRQICDQKNETMQTKQIMELAVKAMKLDFFTSKQQINQENFKSNDIDLEGIKSLKGGNCKLMHQIGSIDLQDAQRFKRMIFRASKGNCFTHFQEFVQEDLINENGKTIKVKKEKMVFIIIFPGIGMENFEAKVLRIIDSFGALCIKMPDSQQSFNQSVSEMHVKIQDLQGTIQNTEKLIKDLMGNFTKKLNGGSCSYIEVLKHYIRKEKNIYFTMNLLKNQGQILSCKVWCPIAYERDILQSISDLHKKNPNIGSAQLMEEKLDSNLSPPTHFRINEFTGVFQQIVDTYGIPRYKEINPALFAIITFPFLYGVMYGDMGHGGLLFIFGCFLVLANNWISSDKKDIFNEFLPLRYMLCMMGFFALYCGWIYNDFMAISIDMFGSCYELHHDMKTNDIVTQTKDCVYKFGLDPVWKQTSNELLFVNSFKMKLSVILGVSQMMLGIVMKGLNAIHFKSKTDFFFEFVPQFIFMAVTFAFMDFMIFYKWSQDYTNGPRSTAPFIINIMIGFLIQMGGVCDEKAESTDIEGALFFTCGGEKQLNFTFVCIAVLMIPIMLFVKPLILNSQNNARKVSKPYRKGSSEKENQPLIELEQNLQKVQNQQQDSSSSDDHHDDHGLGDYMIHQIIETIEFVLGSISNTASYLRLWALSLAHSQLAHVALSQLVQKGVEGGSPILLIGYFYGFAGFTFGILLVMDVMECLLHCLRLHWVEFQNKFYKADGYAYAPFNFKKHLEDQTKL